MANYVTSVQGVAKYTVSHKNCRTLKISQYLFQILTDFQKFFSGTLCGQFAIKWLLNISPHLNCVAALPCEI